MIGSAYIPFVNEKPDSRKSTHLWEEFLHFMQQPGEKGK